jgi:hypothetical protein
VQHFQEMSACPCVAAGGGDKEDEIADDFDWEATDQFKLMMKEGNSSIRKLFTVLRMFYPFLQGGELMFCHEILTLCLFEKITFTDIFKVEVRKTIILRVLANQNFAKEHNIQMGSGYYMWNNLVQILEDDYGVPFLWGCKESDSETEEV